MANVPATGEQETSHRRKARQRHARSGSATLKIRDSSAAAPTNVLRAGVPLLFFLFIVLFINFLFFFLFPYIHSQQLRVQPGQQLCPASSRYCVPQCAEQTERFSAVPRNGNRGWVLTRCVFTGADCRSLHSKLSYRAWVRPRKFACRYFGPAL